MFQENRRMAIVYKPHMRYVKRHNMMMKKPNRIVRSNYRRDREDPLEATPLKSDKKHPRSAPVLVFDMRTGVVLDESTGQKYLLTPIDEQ